MLVNSTWNFIIIFINLYVYQRTYIYLTYGTVEKIS